MKIRYYGHSCFEVKTGESTFLFDPFISPNELASSIDINSIKAETIFLTHGHGDHVADAATIANNNDALIVANFEVANWFSAQGVAKTHPMNPGGSWKFDFGSAKMVTAVHSSSMPDGSYGGNPAGFVMETAEGAFYNAGDTALTYDMKLIAESHDLKFALLPIGDNFTMGVDDAVKAAKFIECDHVIGMHYDTFGYIKIDHAEAIQKFGDAGVKLTLMDIGQTIEL